MKRALTLLAAIAVLGVLVGAALPSAFLAMGDRVRDGVDRQSELPQLLDGLDRARGWYRLALASPPWQLEVQEAEATLDAVLADRYEQQRTTLADGVAGVRAHLSWLDRQAARKDPGAADQARRERVRALISYGRHDLGRQAAEAVRSPSIEPWLALAALHEGRAALLPRGAPQAPGLALWQEGPPPGDDPLGRLVQAERRRRAGDPAAARELLAPLMEPGDPLAPAAAQAWALSLLDEVQVEPAGLSLVSVTDQGPDAQAREQLRALLLASPPSDPAWTGAWLGLSELGFRADDAVGGAAAAAAAVEASRETWQGPVEALPGQARLDAAGSVHPDRVQRVRVALDGLRTEAEKQGRPEAAALRAQVVALLLLQTRAQVAVDNLRAAEGLLERARVLAPQDPDVALWSALCRVLGDQSPAVGSDDSPALQAAVQVWTAAAAPPGPPAAALRQLLAGAPGPTQVQATALAHEDTPAELWLALSAPPSDTVGPGTALAQSSHWLRVATLLGQPEQQELARDRRDRLQRLVLEEPLWALFPLQAFTVRGGPVGAPPGVDHRPGDPPPAG